MVDSTGSEIRCRVQRQKSAWLNDKHYDIQRRNSGLANLCAFLDGGQRWQKSYSGDNRVVAPESSYRRRGLLHRCRLFLSWACRSAQGCGCSPIKRDREMGSERCEAVCLISTGNVVVWKEGVSSTRGTKPRRLWSTGYLIRYAGQLRVTG